MTVTTGLLSTVRAQSTAVDTLRRALAADRVHHAYLFDGPDGVGKERAALRPGAGARVRAARAGIGGRVRDVPRVRSRGAAPGGGRPLHPDVVVLERGLYDPATIGRRSPETQDLSIDQVRTLVLARAAFPPLEGRAKVFIVRRAEELNQQAANALLKTLEEPGPRTHFVLLSAMADSLLPTIRSRTQRVRFGPLPDDVVAELLAAQGAPNACGHRGPGGRQHGERPPAERSGGERAREEFVSRAMAALAARDLGAALELAEEAKKVGKEGAIAQLEALAAALGAQARAAASSEDGTADVAAARHALALAAVQQLDANASVQLALEAMLIKMRSA